LSNDDVSKTLSNDDVSKTLSNDDVSKTLSNDDVSKTLSNDDVSKKWNQILEALEIFHLFLHSTQRAERRAQIFSSDHTYHAKWKIHRIDTKR
jgi:hypothetical protein